MKKILAMLLCVLMLLSACGARDPGEAGASFPGGAPPEQSSEAPEQPAWSGPVPAFALTASMEETVLVDEKDVKITAAALDYTGYDVEVSLLLENNSGRDLTFRAGTMGYCCNSVNGWMVDSGFLNTDVPAGKKANETVSFNVDELLLLGVTDIGELELGFDIADGFDDYLQTGPRQIRTSLAGSSDGGKDTYQEAIANPGMAAALGYEILGESKDAAFEQQGVRILSQMLLRNSDGGQGLMVEVENTADSARSVTLGEISLNGLKVRSGAWTNSWIGPGKRRVFAVNLPDVLDESCRGPLGLQETGSVSCFLEVGDGDGNPLAAPQEAVLTVGKGASFDGAGEELWAGNGIRVVDKGLVTDSSEYSDNVHLLLLVENGTGQSLNFEAGYNSLSVNGFVTDFACYGVSAEPGRTAVLDVVLREDSLEDNGVAGPEDIAGVELTLEARDNQYRTAAEAVIRTGETGGTGGEQ